jgi:hypothetical protein
MPLAATTTMATRFAVSPQAGATSMLAELVLLAVVLLALLCHLLCTCLSVSLMRAMQK